jgi:uncharacterized membrane protein
MIFFVLFLGTVLRLIGINQSFWLDEAAQAMMSSSSVASIWRLEGDFHPPLFHTLLHYWMKLSTTEAYMRLMPLIFGVATIYLLYLFGKRFFNEKIALMASFFLAISPYHVIYSQELRSYSLLVLFSLLSCYVFMAKRWKTYAVINILVFFTNYVYVFVVFSQFLVLVISRPHEIKKFLLAQIPLLIAFILWLPQFMLQLKIGADLVRIQPEWRNLSSPNFIIAIPLTIFKFVAGKIAIDKDVFFIFYAILIVLTVIYILYRLIKRKEPTSKFLLLMIGIPLVTSWLISFFIPLNNPPRLIYVIPFLFLAIADYIYLFKDKHMVYIFLVISLFGIFMQNYVPKNQKEDWRNAVNFIDKNTSDKRHTLAVFEFIAPFAPWLWYEKSGILGAGAVPAKANEKDLDKFLAPVLPGKKQIYLFEYFADVTDPNRLVRKYLEAQQFEVTNFYEFNNIGIVYEMKRVLL